MLAERKRKRKWVINPIKTPLWMHESKGIKFGKELMKKMGWSVGKGLGLKEEGIEEPLRVPYKNDTKGIGFKVNEDDWIEYQDKFNMLLSQLSNNNGTGAMENLEINKPKVESLELKSKHSKVRVHYQKFMRGKDLSNYSDNDLACILGSKTTKEKFKSEPESKSECETSFGVSTINSGSMEDYFKKKKTFHKIKCNNLFKTIEVTENFCDTSTDDGKTLFEENDHKICAQKKKLKSVDTFSHETTEYQGKISADEHLCFAPTEHEKEEQKHKKRKKSKFKVEPPETDGIQESEGIEMEIVKEKVGEKKKNEIVETNFEKAKIKKKKKKNEKFGVKKCENKNQTSEEDLEGNNLSPEDDFFPVVLKEKNMELKNEKKKSKHEKHKLILEIDKNSEITTENTVKNEGFSLAKEKKPKKRKHKSDPEAEETEKSEVVHTGNRNTPSEKQETHNSELAKIAEEKHKSKKKKHSIIETKNDLLSEVMKMKESNPEVLNAKVENIDRVKNRNDSGEDSLKEHNYTSERVLDLIQCADIKEFRGSNLGNVLGYGFKREYLKYKMG